MDNHYAKQQTAALELQDPRQTEAYALIEIARRMEAARTNVASRAELMEVYQLNWKLWTIFQSELTNPENPLPEEIKSNMLQLANFIDQHTITNMRDPNTDGLKVLININRQVGAGLLGDHGEEPVSSETKPSISTQSVGKASAKTKSSVLAQASTSSASTQFGAKAQKSAPKSTSSTHDFGSAGASNTHLFRSKKIGD